MFSFFKNLFCKKETVSYSTTMETGSEGVSAEDALHPDISLLYSKLTKDIALTPEEVNKLSEFYLGVKIPLNGLFIINKGLSSGLCFSPCRIANVKTDGKKVTDIVISLSDLTLNSSLVINMSMKDFYEVFEPLNIARIEALVPKE